MEKQYSLSKSSKNQQNNKKKYAHKKAERKKIRENWNDSIYESDNVLKYSLMLPSTKGIAFSISEDTPFEISEWIGECYKHTETSCRECCNLTSQLFNCTVDDPYAMDTQIVDFARFENDPWFWKFILKQDLIFSAYDKTRKLLATRNPLSGFEFTKLLVPFDNFPNEKNKPFVEMVSKTGLYAYIKNAKESIMPFVALNNGTIQIIHPKKGITDSSGCFNTTNPYCGEAYNSFSTNEGKKAEHAYALLNSYFNMNQFSLYAEEPYDGSILMQLNTLELYSCLIGHLVTQEKDAPKKRASAKPIIAAHSSNSFKGQNYKKYRQTYLDIMNNLSACTKTKKYALVDEVYCKYQLEKLFAVDTVDCLYQNISENSDKEKLKSGLDALGACFLLPNVFSRHYIIQMAFDCRLHDYRELPKYESNSTAAVKMENKSIPSMTYEKEAIWLDRFSSSINLLYKFIFPVMENHFFLTLWNSVRSVCDSDDQCLEKLFLVLSEYLNHPDILNELLSINNSYKMNRKHGYALFYHYDMERLIRPFKHKEKTDYDLYHQCILASNLSKNTSTIIPDFLDVRYLESISPGIIKNIQRTLHQDSRKF